MIHGKRREATDFSLDEYLDALDTLHDAQMYLARQFNHNMPPDRARAYFGARFTLVSLQKQVDADAERQIIEVAR